MQAMLNLLHRAVHKKLLLHLWSTTLHKAYETSKKKRTKRSYLKETFTARSKLWHPCVDEMLKGGNEQ